MKLLDRTRISRTAQYETLSTILAFGVALLLGACSGHVEEEIPLVQGEGGVYLGGTFRWNSVEDVRSLDPVRVGDTASGDVALQIYDSLVAFDTELQIIPALAERWEISPDGLTYTFHLRQGVRFHDNLCFPDGVGRECTAEDIVYSLQRVVHPGVLTTGLWAFQDLFEGVEAFREKEDEEGYADHVSGLVAVDRYTVRIQLTHPFPPFLQRLIMSYGFIVPREAVEHYGEDFFQYPVGTGPFQFVSWTKDLELVLERNPNYWQKDEHGNSLPYIGRMVNTFMKNQNTEFQEFELGNLETHYPVADDLFETIITPEDELQPQYAGRFQVSSKSMMSTYYYGFTLNKEPFGGNLKLRQAFNYAIDREAIIKHVLKGRATPFQGIVPPSTPGWKSSCIRYEYNPELAKQLLAEAGYPNGEGFPELECLFNSGGKRNERISEVLQQQLAELGIRVRLQILEWPQFLDLVEDGRATFWRLGWMADYLDPENFLSLLDSRKFGPGGPNNARYINPDYDALFQASDLERDPVKRFDLLRRAEEICVADAPWLFLHHMVDHRLSQSYVHNLEQNAMNHLLLKYAWMEPHGEE